MNNVTVPYNFEPRWYQLDIFKQLDSGKKRALLVWARRAGKDKLCFNYMVKEMFNRVGVYYYFFPTYEQGRKALWENVDKEGFKSLYHIPGMDEAKFGKIPNQIIKRVSNQSMTIELQNGSLFRIVAADSVEQSIVGTNPVGMVFSEYSLQDPMGWKLMAPVARENKGWVIFNGTPRGRNHQYDMHMLVQSDPKWVLSYLPIDKMGMYTEEEIEEIISDSRTEGMTEDEIQQEMFCSYSAGVKGAFYADQIQTARAQGRIDSYVIDDHAWVDTFWDLGIDDSTAIWFRQVRNGKVIFIDYHEESGKSISDYVKILQSKGYNYRTHWLPHDGNHKTFQTGKTTRDILADTLRSAGINDDVVCVGKLPIQDGINAVRKRFSFYHFNEGLCDKGIKALEAYHRRWDSKRQTFLQQPVHDWSSHCADALRVEAISEDLYEDKFYSVNKIKVNTDFDALN